MLDKNKIIHIQNLISERVRVDQEMRQKWATSGFSTDAYDADVDVQNEKLLKHVIDAVGGWPMLSVFGKETVDKLWVLVQHTPNTKLRSTVLAEMKKLPEEEVEKKRIAQVEDRIRIEEGKPQLYGTSFTINLQTNEVTADPIEDFDNIDARRAAMGMDTFAEHLARAREEYVRSQAKKEGL